MKEIIALAGKDLRLLLRDKVGFFFTFGFPLVFAIFFGTIFGSEGETPAIAIAVVDEDDTEASRAFFADLSAGPELAPVMLATRESAIEKVRLGQKTAYVILPVGFGESVESLWSGGGAPLIYGIDPSRRAEGGMLEGLLTSYAYRRLQALFEDPQRLVTSVDDSLAQLESTTGMPGFTRSLLQQFFGQLKTFLSQLPAESSEQAAQAFKTIDIQKDEVSVNRVAPKNSYEISFAQGALWAILGCAAAFGISLVVERTQGTLIRLRSAPIHRFQILLGKALACFLTTMAAQIVLLLLAVAFFDVRPDSLVRLLLAMGFSSIAFVGIMMFLAVLGKTEQAAGGIGWAVLMVFAMIGGGMIPQFVMPGWMASMARVSPVYWAIYASEGAIWRGLTWAQMLVPYGILLAIGIAFFALGAKLFQWEETG